MGGIKGGKEREREIETGRKKERKREGGRGSGQRQKLPVLEIVCYHHFSYRYSQYLQPVH